MRSSRSRFIASRLAPRCAACGGSNVPPNNPIRMPGACGGSTSRGDVAPAEQHNVPEPASAPPLFAMISTNGGYGFRDRAERAPPNKEMPDSRPDLPRAADAILEAGELLDANRTARVQLAGGDADL